LQVRSPLTLRNDDTLPSLDYHTAQQSVFQDHAEFDLACEYTLQSMEDQLLEV